MAPNQIILRTVKHKKGFQIIYSLELRETKRRTVVYTHSYSSLPITQTAGLSLLLVAMGSPQKHQKCLTRFLVWKKKKSGHAVQYFSFNSVQHHHSLAYVTPIFTEIKSHQSPHSPKTTNWSFKCLAREMHIDAESFHISTSCAWNVMSFVNQLPAFIRLHRER